MIKVKKISKCYIGNRANKRISKRVSYFNIESREALDQLVAHIASVSTLHTNTGTRKRGKHIDRSIVMADLKYAWMDVFKVVGENTHDNFKN
jgi:hypothetical protein